MCPAKILFFRILPKGPVAEVDQTLRELSLSAFRQSSKSSITNLHGEFLRVDFLLHLFTVVMVDHDTQLHIGKEGLQF